MSPTIHVQLFPTTFPPAHIDLEAEKRSFHRRLSTRKLEAARGKTTKAKLFLDLDSKKEPIVAYSPTSPRTRAVRRKGQLFNSPTSTESDDDDSLSSLDPVTVTHSNRPPAKFNAAENKAKTTTTADGPKQLAQPFLLQLRSLPVAPLTTTNIKQDANPDPIINNSTTNNNNNMLSTTASHPPCDLSYDAKRRKLAKLQRFLGETIPPELVFPTSSTSPATITTTTTSPLQRSTSVLDSGSRGKVSHKPSRSISTSKTPTPLSATAPTTPLSQSTREPVVEQPPTPTPRPQSMTTLPSPTMATTTPSISTRGASLDGGSSSNLILPFQNIMEQGTTQADQHQLRYRKEGKGWSGEWNVKDMEQVANALRGLKVR